MLYLAEREAIVDSLKADDYAILRGVAGAETV
jgi:hypothetical protein